MGKKSSPNKSYVQMKMGHTMSEWKSGTPMSNGRVIKSQKQAEAIAYSMARKHAGSSSSSKKKGKW